MFPLAAAAFAGSTATASAGGAAAGLSLGGTLSLAGKLLGAFGTLSSAFAQSDALKQHARELRKEGREARLQSDYRTRLIRQEGAEIQGGIEAETAKSGLAMVGTPLNSLVDTARQVELAARLQYRSGILEEKRYDAAARAAEKEAKNAKRSGFINAVGGLLG